VYILVHKLGLKATISFLEVLARKMQVWFINLKQFYDIRIENCSVLQWTPLYYILISVEQERNQFCQRDIQQTESMTQTAAMVSSTAWLVLINLSVESFVFLTKESWCGYRGLCLLPSIRWLDLTWFLITLWACLINKLSCNAWLAIDQLRFVAWVE